MNTGTRTGRPVYRRVLAVVALIAITTAASMRLQADTGTCGGVTTTVPFTDVMGNIFFCSIAEAYFSGLTSGTTPTTFSPGATVTREQMAAFVTRTLNQSLERGSERAVLDQFWTTQGPDNLGLTTVGQNPRQVKSDGTDLWVTNISSGSVSRVSASDGKLLETWTGATNAFGVLVAMGKVFVTGYTVPGNLYQIDPAQPEGMVTTLSSSLGGAPAGIAFDGQRIWTTNNTPPGSISIVTLNPVSVTTLTAGFTFPEGILFDGANIWVTDFGDDTLKKLDSNGAVVLSVPMGGNADPEFPAFDGTNIWVPNRSSNTLVVVRAIGGNAGTVLATLSGNGLSGSHQAAFDGERILVTNFNGGPNTVSLWKASDFSPMGTFSTGPGSFPLGVCSDGLNFWITLSQTHKLARF